MPLNGSGSLGRPPRYRRVAVALLLAATAHLPAAATTAGAERLEQQSVELNGTVTAARGGQLRVEIPPGATAGPAVGDAVEFKTESRGFAVAAGKGEVAEIDGAFAWVRVTDGRPRLGMSALIHATGPPMVATPGGPAAGAPAVATTGGSNSAAPGGATGLSTSGVPGYFELLLPVNFAPHIHEETGDSWTADSLWGFHGVSGERTAPQPEGVRPGDRLTITVSGFPAFVFAGRPISKEEASRLNHEGWKAGKTDRFSGRAVDGQTSCVGYSVEDPGYLRYWSFLCESSGRGYGIDVQKDVRYVLPSDDETVERIVRSFKPLR